MPEHAIRATGLVKAFKKTRALRGVDLEVRTGTVTALLGRNGAGNAATELRHSLPMPSGLSLTWSEVVFSDAPTALTIVHGTVTAVPGRTSRTSISGAIRATASA